MDHRRALEFYLKAAELEVVTAYTMLGNVYSEGRGVAVDCAQALSWTRKGVAASDPVAVANLANAYQTGCGVESDLAEARRLYEQAIAMGFAEAQQGLDELDALAREVVPDRE